MNKLGGSCRVQMSNVGSSCTNPREGRNDERHWKLTTQLGIGSPSCECGVAGGGYENKACWFCLCLSSGQSLPAPSQVEWRATAHPQ
jgi:hypothetical protein